MEDGEVAAAPDSKRSRGEAGLEEMGLLPPESDVVLPLEPVGEYGVQGLLESLTCAPPAIAPRPAVLDAVDPTLALVPWTTTSPTWTFGTCEARSVTPACGIPASKKFGPTKLTDVFLFAIPACADTDI